jgi:5-methylcytosine-specific restriction endonuclease McrA
VALDVDAYYRDDGGNPLGVEYPSGRPLRGDDGSSWHAWWCDLMRGDLCAYCGGPAPAGTVDHVEPRARPARGVGGTHSWTNVVGACEACNGAKGAKPLLTYLLYRAQAADARARGERRRALRAAA